MASGFIHFDLGLPWARAVYDSVLLATLGIGDLTPHTILERVVVVALVFGEIGTGAYFISTLTGLFVEEDIGRVWGRRRMERQVRNLKSHIILAGGGRVGRQAAREVKSAGGTPVVIEQDPEVIQALTEEGFLVVEGDASDAKVLEAAGIRRAQALIACIQKDSDNLYIVLAARELNPRAVVVARAEEPRSERRLIQAGANRVVFPTRMGGRRLARLALQPASADLVDSSFLWRHGFDLLEVAVDEGSLLVGRTLAALRKEAQVLVVALGVGSDLQVPPPAQVPLEVGMRLVVAGNRPEIARFREAFRLGTEEEEVQE